MEIELGYEQLSEDEFIALYHRIGQSLIDAVPTDQCGIWLNFEIIKNALSGWAFYRKPSGSYGYLEIPDDAEAALLEMHQSLRNGTMHSGRV
ncbi:hypothetical protein C7E14_22670 [Stenotrophomonas maltophilia]|nr:hypothetical protein C7E14_22670 [Stenotrophomonas maltophilia]